MRTVSAVALLAILSGPARAADVDFNRDVRPILSDKCFSCHGPDEKHRKAKLRLDVESDARDAGAIVPGKPEKSALIEKVTAMAPDERMPPVKSGKKLTTAEIEVLRKWIVEGGKYAPHWAYVPPVRSALPMNSRRSTDPIDAFILARLDREKLAPAKEADRRTLARRLSFDLTGLPPTPDEVDAFIADRDERAYEKMVDRLLASEHFGERMATYWLDLVRYADTVGYHGDQDHHASPYRDYVIDAFNRNVPFDQFTREQLAGDLLPKPTMDQKIATCYNRLLQTSHEGGVQPKEYLAIYAADRVRNLSAVWMGATVGCAQCHDHKFDPYTSRDFYSLAAFFADVDEERHLRGGGADTVPTKRAPEIPVHTRRERERIATLEEKIEALQKAPAGEEEKTQLAALTKERDALKKAQRMVMVTQAVAPRTVRLLPRGNWLDDSGSIVEPAIPAFLGKLSTSGRGSRLDLANWLVDANAGAGGLTARVFVNRLWYLFFGAGLSKSLEDFGGQGEPPVHPELLDNLAVEFVESKWDVKRMVKFLVMSQTYRQSSVVSGALRERDPENRLFARQSSWRHSAEGIRDNALFVSGLLVLDIGGPSAKPYQPPGFYKHLNFPKREYVPDTGAKQYRRGVYVHWQRQYLHPMFKAFDASTREECTAQRARSNTPLAALVLLNDPTFVEAARVLAQRTMDAGKTDADRIRFAFRQVTTRRPHDAEMKVLERLLVSNRAIYKADEKAALELVRIGLAPRPAQFDAAELAAWTMMCRALLNLSETITRE
jgi:hypothetical protein